MVRHVQLSGVHEGILLLKCNVRYREEFEVAEVRVGGEGSKILDLSLDR